MTITTIKEFSDALIEGVRADFEDLPKGSAFAWFPTVTNAPTVFRHGEQVPFDPYSRIIALFQDEGVAKVYSMPAAPPNPVPADWKSRAPTRYTLTKTAPTYFAETMSLDAMASELIDEWNQIADGVNAADMELEAVIGYIEDQLANTDGSTDLISVSALLEDLRGEVHRGLDSDDGSDETANGEPVASAAPVVPTDAPNEVQPQ